jgi:predicted nucleic acid-binding protein
VTAWLDTSALVSLYVPEARSERVARLVGRSREPIPFSQLHELELVNALRLRMFRREARPAQVDATLARIVEDLNAGTLARAALDWPAVLGSALELADRHTSRVGCRSLDVLHVAAATAFGARRFVTADRRQAALARRAGLAIARVG